MSLKGLVVREPWIGLILAGKKTWEMRSTPCRHRGPVALIAKGTGTVVGLADLVDDLPPLNAEGLRATQIHHQIPVTQIEDAVREGWIRPWVLANVRRLDSPVPYRHTSGGSWVNLTPDEEAKVSGSSALAFAPEPRKYGGRLAQLSDRQLTDLVLQDIAGQPHNIAVPPEAVIITERLGNELHISVEWDDDFPQRRRKIRFKEVAGISSLFFLLVSFTGFIFHFILGIVLESVSAIGAFKWLVPVFLFAMLATLFGEGDAVIEMAGRSRRRS